MFFVSIGRTIYDEHHDACLALWQIVANAKAAHPPTLEGSESDALAIQPSPQLFPRSNPREGELRKHITAALSVNIRYKELGRVEPDDCFKTLCRLC